MKLIEKKEDKVIFSTKMDVSLANAIRRSVQMIPIMAIDEVEITKNDSALYDETVAHRIGLVPIKMPKNQKEEIIKFKLKKKGPGYVYAGDFVGEAEIVYPGIPITLLKEGQEIKLVGKTKLGKGKDHAKFSPGILTYRIISEITLPKRFKEKIESKFPNEIKEKNNSITIIDNLEKPILDFCEGLCQREGIKAEVKDTNEILFLIESFGQISPEEIFKGALTSLKKELKEIQI